MESLKTQINEHIDSATAVIVVANGTVPGVTLATSSALSTLSTILAKVPTRNIAVMLTNVSSPLYQNFAPNVLPAVLQDAPQFRLNNPVALQKKYLERKDVPKVKKRGAKLCNAVETDEQAAMDMVVELFDWLDGLEPKPNMVDTSLYGEPPEIIGSATDLHTPMNPAATKRTPVLPLLASAARIMSQ